MAEVEILIQIDEDGYYFDCPDCGDTGESWPTEGEALADMGWHEDAEHPQ